MMDKNASVRTSSGLEGSVPRVPLRFVLENRAVIAPKDLFRKSPLETTGILWTPDNHGRGTSPT